MTATDLFAKQGFEETSTLEIAKAAGISQATIFKYFKTKQDLLLAVVEPVMSHFFPTYLDDFFRDLSKCQYLTEMVRFVLTDRYQFVTDNIQVVKIVVREMMTTPGLRQKFGKTLKNHDFDFLADLLTNFRQTGELCSDIDAASLLRIIAGQLAIYLIQSNYAPVLVHGPAKDLELMTSQIVRTLKK